MEKFSTVEDYITGQPVAIQSRLKKIRSIIKKTVPEAEEIISYGMPAYKYHGMLVYFAAFKNHFGFYPMAASIEKFKSRLRGYKTSKGTIQFPFEGELPIDLITDIVKFRMNENLKKTRLKESIPKKKSR